MNDDAVMLRALLLGTVGVLLLPICFPLSVVMFATLCHFDAKAE